MSSPSDLSRLLASASGECADDLEKLLDGAMLASPQVVA